MVTYPLQVERRTGKVRRSKTDVLPTVPRNQPWLVVVGVDSGSLHRLTQLKSSGLVLGRRPLGAVLHSSNEPGELLEWLCHDDSTINIVLKLLLLLLLLLPWL